MSQSKVSAFELPSLILRFLKDFLNKRVQTLKKSLRKKAILTPMENYSLYSEKHALLVGQKMAYSKFQICSDLY